MMRSTLAVTLLVTLLSTTNAYWKNEGRSFAINFPPTFNWGSTGTCQLAVTSRFSGTVRVDAAFLLLNQTQAVSPRTRVTFDLSATSRPVGPGLDNEAIYITADVDIVVVAYNYVPATGTSGGQRSGYLLFPVTDGDSYVLHTHSISHSSTGPHAYYTAVATQDNTMVTVYSPVAGGGYTFRESFTLNRGQCYSNTTAMNEDLTGVKLVSTKQISLTAGHSNLKLTDDAAWRTQAIGSSIFPTRAFSYDYVVPGIVGADPIASEIRVVAVTPTSATVVMKDGANQVTINEGQFTSYTQSDMTRASTISCSQPCSVALYTKQDNADEMCGTIQFTVVPETAFTSGGLMFVTPSSADTAIGHHISIVVEGTDTSGIQLDGTTLTLTWATVTVGGTTYSHATTAITDGAHELSSGTHRIAAYVYGHYIVDASRGMSYGYPAGFDDIYYVTTTPSTTAATTTPGSGSTAPPSGDIRNAPGYEFVIWGNFTSGNGQNFSASCTDQYSLDMSSRSIEMGQSINSRVAVIMCQYLAQGDMKIETTTTHFATFGAVGTTQNDFVSSSKNHLTFAQTKQCAEEMSVYLQDHFNWGYPILQQRPGCPFVNFTQDQFIQTASRWYCRDNTGPSLPDMVIPLYANFTAPSTISPACTQAYADQMERQAQDQMVVLQNNMMLWPGLCSNYGNLRVWRVTTSLTTTSLTTGWTRVYYYLQSTSDQLRYTDVYACHDEIYAYLQPHSNWGSPLLTQEPGCPFLTFDPAVFYNEDNYWFCNSA